MKGKWLPYLLALACAAALLCAAPALADEGEGEAEWTVLFYMCGSDLESKYSYATQNLEEIAGSVYPTAEISDILSAYDMISGGERTLGSGRVNVLIETGGCKQWHAQGLGMDISTTALQRWRYEGYLYDDQADGFFLEQSLPLQSMADPETLTDFVRWGAKAYPAKKIALVLWDHGGGSKTGIFIDELFEGDIMYLDELGDALRDSGVHLEAVLFDACLMAGLETAYAICDSADWMIASEELVAGKGTAVGRWLQQLYIAPGFGGEWLGRWICDMTQIKYANEDDAQAQQLLTWSVIDLKKVPDLVAMLDAGYKTIGVAYTDYPALLSNVAHYLMNIERFGSEEGNEGMWDLTSLLYAPSMAVLIPADIYQKMLEAQKEAVVYCVRGPGRSSARGISYCYAVDFDIEELDLYARNCPMPHYLAYLDVISAWTAPDWVYETAGRLPEISELDAYRIVVEKVRREDGTPALAFVGKRGVGAGTVRYRLFKRDADTGKMVSMGIMPAWYDASFGENGLYTAVEPWMWPALEGQHVASYVINMVEPGDINYMASIPIQIGTEKWFLRYGYFGGEDRYTVYGLWEGYNTDTQLFNRNVKSLSQLSGQEYSLLYPVMNGDYEAQTEFAAADPQTIYRAMYIEDLPLPPGTYYMQYIVYDMYNRPIPLEAIEVEWTGEEMILPEDFSWEGEVELKISEAYW